MFGYRNKGCRIIWNSEAGRQILIFGGKGINIAKNVTLGQLDQACAIRINKQHDIL
jgi:hypothetical protein